MEQKYYSNERSVQIVLHLLKANGIRRVIVSPGATNVTIVGSMQQDPWFEMYSSVDERSAAYMACGLAAESGKPVVLSCTGATASRNYYPGLTEAYYRKLPIIAITSSQDFRRIGQLAEQCTDRRHPPKDLVVCSEQLQFVENADDEWIVTVKVNRAMHALKKNGGGPVHLNLETHYSRDFSVKELPAARKIDYCDATAPLPDMPKGKVAIFIGSHVPMSRKLTESIDRFCAAYGAVVFCSHVSNYKGDYAVSNSLVCIQDDYESPLFRCDLLITMGEITGGDAQFRKLRSTQQWRVNPDGEIRDLFRGLTAVFAMPEQAFFEHYASCAAAGDPVSAEKLREPFDVEYSSALSNFPEVGFSNIWIAQHTAPALPEKCELHLAILNSLRCWNFFPVPKSVNVMSNTGGFGIDGVVSSLIGASLANPKKLFFGIVGDLAFFYDLNSMGNRHVGPNVRIMLMNNGRGMEFRNPYHACTPFGDDADRYMAAAHHFGDCSHELVKHFATDLGYDYLAASNKEEFNAVIGRFLNREPADKPIIFEVFLTVEDEASALWLAHHALSDPGLVMNRKMKAAVNKVVPGGAKAVIRKIIGRK